MRKTIIIVIIFYLCLCCCSTIAYSYDHNITHPDMASTAISASKLDEYLKTKLQFTDGVGFILSFDKLDVGQPTIRNILRAGSTDEDLPPCRASNHFHNPLKSWDSAGLSSMPALFCSSKWAPPGSSTRYSALTWATGYVTQPPNGQKATFSPNPDYTPNSWDNARKYFYSALTSENKTARENDFAKTFQAVGQTLHLLQDMAVPA